MANRAKKEEYIFYAPDPENLGELIVVGKIPFKYSHFQEGKCAYCGAVYFISENCPNCSAPRQPIY